MSDARVPYAGIATRAIALAIDVAIVHVLVFAGGAILALAGSLVSDLRLDTLARILVAGAWAGAVAAYFVTFWSTAGQTPGMRVMYVRVRVADGGLPTVRRSLVRVAGLALATAPLFAGFLPVLVDDRRRGLHDFLAGTVIVHTGPAPLPLEGPHPASRGARVIEPPTAMPEDRQGRSSTKGAGHGVNTTGRATRSGA